VPRAGLNLALRGLWGEFAAEPGPGTMLNQGGNVIPDSSVSQGLVFLADDSFDMWPGRLRKARRQPIGNCTDNGFLFRFAHHASFTRGWPGVNQERGATTRSRFLSEMCAR
jgi:hypothetical protein